MPKKPHPAEAAAVAKFTTARVKPDQVSGETQKVADIVKQNPALAQHPEIQQGLTNWQNAADTVDQTSQKIKALHIMLTALIATLATNMAAWRRASHAMVALVNTASGGSAEAIKQWGFLVAVRSLIAATTDAPQNLRVAYTKALAMVVRWKAVQGQRGYLLQIGDGTPQGWGPSIQCARARYEPQGLTPGQKVAFRVAVQRKNGVSAWSDALIVTAR